MSTVAADDSVALAGDRSVYELTGLDRDHWIIVGLDIITAATQPRVVVYWASLCPGQARIEQLVDRQDTLPVMAYSITDPNQIQAQLDEGFGSLSKLRLLQQQLGLATTG